MILKTESSKQKKKRERNRETWLSPKNSLESTVFTKNKMENGKIQGKTMMEGKQDS